MGETATAVSTDYIHFHRPSIGTAEEQEVLDTLRSGWLTTGGKTKAFEADLGECVQRVYDKLFFGNNLPAMTPPGEHYDPTWSDAEIRILCSVIAAGLHLFRSHLGGHARQRA